MTIIDFSGHSLTKTNVADLTDPQSYFMEAVRLLTIIRKDQELNECAQNGTLTIIMPGLSVLTLVVVSLFHGYFGYFPKVQWYTKTPDGFILNQSGLDLQELRDEARTWR
jgi:hypothetical protein